MNKNVFKFAFAIQAIISIAIIIGVFSLIYFVFTNPEGVGEFFGRISNGFNNSK